MLALARLGHADEGARELLKLPAASLASDRLMLSLSDTYRHLAQPPKLVTESTRETPKGIVTRTQDVRQPMTAMSLRCVGVEDELW